MLPIQTLIRHEATVHSIALQGDLLLSGSEDNDVKVSTDINLSTFPKLFHCLHRFLDPNYSVKKSRKIKLNDDFSSHVNPGLYVLQFVMDVLREG